MPKTVDEAKKVHVTEIVRHSGQIMIPDDMTIEQVREVLKRREEYENQSTIVSSTFDCLPYDGANALFAVLKRRFGWASMETVYSWFGEMKPVMLEVEVGVGKVSSVPWGRLSLFKKEGHIDCNVAKKNGRFLFKADATVLRKHEGVVKEIYAEVRKELAANSIYRGKAISIRFRDDDGEPLGMPDAKFVDTTDITQEQLIFSDKVNRIINTNLFTPIRHRETCNKFGIKFRRGVLLAGVYGVGKTLAAKVAAGIAVSKGITFIYCKRAEEFAEAVEFAIQYQPAVVFCEDIDRVLAGERSVKMDDILNIVDGIDTKAAEVMIVLTSNAPEAINPAGLRPGRLDSLIQVLPPDAEAVARLIQLYAAGTLASDLDLSKVAAKLEGNIPAVIEEVVKRSKLAALKDNPDSSKIVITELALEEAADTMEMQLALLNGPKDPTGHRGSLTMKEVIEPIVRETMDTVYGR